MKRSSNLVTFAGNPVTMKGKLIKEGVQAKNFTAVGNDLKLISLSDFKGKVRIISSVPSLDTGVCAAQTMRFNKEASQLKNTQIITISCDLPFAQKRFCTSQEIANLVTVSDHRETEFGVKYGFLIEELRLLARGVIIIDKEDTVRYVELVKEITEHPNYDKALEVAKSLS
ncbi:MAG TPA: thiol peroxidase [Bacteroidales bacterium]|nr:thiol peroxidase [Bacteroidales bacterium]